MIESTHYKIGQPYNVNGTSRKLTGFVECDQDCSPCSAESSGEEPCDYKLLWDDEDSTRDDDCGWQQDNPTFPLCKCKQDSPAPPNDINLAVEVISAVAAADCTITLNKGLNNAMSETKRWKVGDVFIDGNGENQVCIEIDPVCMCSKNPGICDIDRNKCPGRPIWDKKGDWCLVRDDTWKKVSDSPETITERIARIKEKVANL